MCLGLGGPQVRGAGSHVGGVADHCGCPRRRGDHSLTQQGCEPTTGPCPVPAPDPSEPPSWPCCEQSDCSPGLAPCPDHSDWSPARPEMGAASATLPTRWGSSGLSASPILWLLLGEGGHRCAYDSVSFSSPLLAALAGCYFQNWPWARAQPFSRGPAGCPTSGGVSWMACKLPRGSPRQTPHPQPHGGHCPVPPCSHETEGHGVWALPVHGWGHLHTQVSCWPGQHTSGPSLEVACRAPWDRRSPQVA